LLSIICSKYARPSALFIDISLIEMNQFCYVIIFLVVGGFDNLLFHLIDVHTGVWAAMHG